MQIQVTIARTDTTADPQAARARRAADRERIADLAARIIDLECSLRALRVEKALLEAEQDIIQDRLSAYTYPVLTLSPELVSEIFEHFVPVFVVFGARSPSLLRCFGAHSKIFLRPGGSVQNEEADRAHTALCRVGVYYAVRYAVPLPTDHRAPGPLATSQALRVPPQPRCSHRTGYWSLRPTLFTLISPSLDFGRVMHQAFQRLHIDEASLLLDRIAALQSLLSHWGSSPQEICIGFPALPLHLYSAALPSIVFSSTRRDPLPIYFLDPQPTNLVGLEAMNIDEEGDWDEASSSESEESDSSESGEESTSESGKESTSESGEESDAQEGDTDDDSE
ncbi:hypothetical protein B0H16DRAFT_1801625 [Mycena metata]|uniref:Uncharacterized protein n=1 Tax=Mycena metata TaxID=1033252 RepID=A0AAD7MGV4_9AGAR|nr:hypothetical protein B0H16DRAFT_1801625 [Mycena metata]